MIAPMARAGDITVEIKKINSPTAKGKPDPKKKGPPPPEIDKAKLAITLKNTSSKDYKGLALKYYFFSHGAASPGTTIEKQGEKPVDLAPGASTSVETEEATCTYQPAYSDKGKRIHATGSKLAGAGAQVVQGSTVLGEFFTGGETMKKVLTAPAGGGH